ncbi:MAG: DUF4112 domain-containing protein [Phenylobacterium sp.]|uniref:DUF4112 domain-containing protein n=1 Tax=Phenylobacterium sp. TaxID=1871053 RepID=UPI0027338CC6|nr:DUF4112 domain-containing protein [Phenylobacterium sp.]MDP3173952.1 DUF4112 domain-containing protein [Phenylobacterium sp.]
MSEHRETAHRAWRSAERIKRLSDRLVGIGPFGLGLDGVLAWVPGANVVYSVGAAGLLIYEGVLAGASAATLARMGLYLAADSATSGVPVVGWAIDTLFPGHLMAAKALQKDIEARHGPSVLTDSWFGRRGVGRAAKAGAGR